jgi:mycothiol synthase
MATQRELEIEGYAVRPPGLPDLDAVVELINQVAWVDTGQNGTTREEKYTEWTLSEFTLETDARLILTPGGQPVGYVEVWDEKPHVRYYLWGRVHPGYRDRGLGTQLLEWAQGRARQSLRQAPPGARVTMHTSTPNQNQAAADLFRSQGFELVRHFYRMLVEMEPGTPPQDPVLPRGVTLRPFVLGEDDRAVHRTIDEAFKDHWGYVSGESFEDWMHWIEEDSTFDPATCMVAVTQESGEEQIVGVAMTHGRWEGDPSVAWVDELAVLRPWRRQGIGLALLHAVFGAYFRRGSYKVGLSVDAESLTGAPQIYERAGMHIFHQTDAYEKVLRAGQELSIQALEEPTA